jgi:pantoate--beta-alanine ligase
MVRDLNFPIELHGIATVREPDGLAMSSRNRYLTPEERAQAPALQQALQLAHKARLSGEHDATRLLEKASQHIEQHASLGRIDYLSLVDAHTLQPVTTLQDGGLIALAVFFGKARLIDNIELMR